MPAKPLSPLATGRDGQRNLTDHWPTLQALIDSLATHADKPCILALRPNELERWSYAQVSDHVHRLAAGLVAAGVERGQHVVLLAASRPEWYIASLAVIAMGAVVVPLDTAINNDALAHTLRDSDAQWVFTTTDYLNRIAHLDLPAAPRTVVLDVAPEDPRGWQALQAAAPASLPRVASDDPAVLFYTSGTTGVPKGVPLTHGNLAFQVDALLHSGLVTPSDRALQPLPMYHVYPFMVGLVVMALGTYVVLPGGMTGPQIIRAIQQGEPTLMTGVPRLYRALYTGIEARMAESTLGPLLKLGMRLNAWTRRRLGWQLGRVLLRPLHRRLGAPLRLMISGGSPLDADLAEKLEGLGWDVAIGYGLSETSPLLTLNLPGSRKLASVGKPLPGIEIRIDSSVSAVDEGPLPAGNGMPQGEILARGPSVFSGYRNLPHQTAAAFTADGWFRTGDLGYLDADGYLYITGRANTLIVLEGGKKIQPDPLEEVYAQHPCIQEIGILKAGHELAAVIVPEMAEVNRWANGDVALAVRQAVKDISPQLPTYQRITDYVISLDPLPKTNLGKIRRHQLAELYEQTKQGSAPTITTSAHPIAVEDMSEQDRALLDHPAAHEVWDWLATRYPDRALTPDSSPQLDLGVDSLGWLTLTLEIEERTGVELSDEAIARVTTVRDLLHEVRAASPIQELHGSALADSEAALTPEEQRSLEPLKPFFEAINVLLLILNRKLMLRLFHLEVHGLENLPDRSPIVLAPNHRSYLDSFALAGALPNRYLFRTYWAAGADIMFQNALLRFTSQAMRIIPITRNVGTGRSSLVFGAVVLRRKHNLVWFPEGSITLTGGLRPFRQGLGIVLEKVPATVVPVYLRGTDEALPIDKLRLRLRPLSVTFGEPCDSHELAQVGVGENEAARIVAALHDRVAALGEPRQAPETAAAMQQS